MSRHVATAITAVAIAAMVITGATAATAPGQTLPVNQTPPSISGSAQVGSTLTASPGTWSGKSLSYAYQWARCSSSGASCSAIGGATASTDSLTSADAGSTLRVTVTATNRNGSAVATSAQTAVVASASSSPPPPPPSPPDSSWTFCANEGGRCSFSDTREVVYGANGAFTSPKQFTGGVDCNNTVFGDPVPGTAKACFQRVPATPAPPPPSTSGVIADEGTIRLGDSPTYMTNAGKFAAIAVGGYLNLVVPKPGKPIEYSSGTQVEPGSPTEVDWTTARANGWLAHNASGQEIGYAFDGNGLLVNSGNVSFQNATKTKILNWLAANPGVDGVYFDNFMLDVRNFPGVSYPIYDQNNNLLWSNNADFQAAQISFISNVGAALKAAGYLVGVNAKGYISGAPCCDNDNGVNSENWMDKYAPYVSAAMIEYWQQRGDTHSVELSGNDTWDHHWDGWQGVENYAQSKGIQFWPISYIAQTGEDSQCRFLRGSYLLEWNGKGSIMLMPYGASDIWNTCTAFNPGQPSGAKYVVATSTCAGNPCYAYRRDFSNGYVIVNPTQSAVSVGGISIASGDAVLHQN